MKLRLLPAAERDLEIGADFYEAQSPGLGVYFTKCLSADIESLHFRAGIHERQHGFFRAIAKHFPFAIYYQVGDDSIDIYAVLDCRQDPRTTDARLNPQGS